MLQTAVGKPLNSVDRQEMTPTMATLHSGGDWLAAEISTHRVEQREKSVSFHH